MPPLVQSLLHAIRVRFFGSTGKSVPPEGLPQFSSMTPRPASGLKRRIARKGNLNKRR
jgi:hypothetical protein